MDTFSIRARVKRSLSRNFWSMMTPERTLRSLVRKKVSPRAFCPCWNSSTTHKSPSHSMVMPFRKSLGFTMSGKGLYPVPANSKLAWPATSLDLGEDRISELLRAGDGAEHLGAIPPGRLQLDVPEPPGPAPQPLEGGEVLDPIDRNRPRKLRNDALVQDDALVGQHVLVRPPAPVIEVEDAQANHDHTEH